MRWKNRGPSEFLSEKTFLVIKNNLNVFDGGSNDLYPKNKPLIPNTPRSRTKSVAANAGTWPPKLKKNPSASSATSLERPKTANLDEPTFLDPRLVDKLDMSMLSKELLLDSMTHIQLLNGGVGAGIEDTRATAVGIERRRQSFNIPSGPARREYNWGPGRTSAARPGYDSATSNSGIISLRRQKRKSFEAVTDSETYDRRDTSPEVRASMKKQAGKSTQGTNEAVFKRLNSEPRSRDGNNNKRATGGSLTPKISALTMAKKKSSKTSIKSDVEVFVGATTKAPEPCKTCGRSDQPERFHSHPKTTLVPVKIRDNGAAVKPKVAVPKSVQKPVALNFRSEKRRGDKSENPAGILKNPLQEPRENLKEKSNPQSANSSPKRGPRSITCYVCSREFGTASFPIHEPKCLQKWERENNALPQSQRRPAPPQRPQVLPGHQGWNEAAWEQSQAQLLPCSRCGRTFLPDRLPVHEKSCKTQRKNPPGIQKEEVDNPRVRAERSGGAGSGTPAVSKEPPMVFCQICGRSFGSRSIKIHEPQCLKRWQAENEGLPPPQRRKDPSSPPSANSSTLRAAPIPQKKAVPCYICGRDFGSSSIAIHEPQCLRKWHQENDKLPPGQRRQQPEKPDIVFTCDETGTKVVDHIATAEAKWQSHLGQLVPCKRCGRTFNPDRVAIHERGCKGTR